MEFSKPLVVSWLRRMVPVLLGAMAGYGYYYFIGCVSGTCPITSNPWISTAYGAGMGFLLIPKGKQRTSRDKESEQ